MLPDGRVVLSGLAATVGSVLLAAAGLSDSPLGGTVGVLHVLAALALAQKPSVQTTASVWSGRATILGWCVAVFIAVACSQSLTLGLRVFPSSTIEQPAWFLLLAVLWGAVAAVGRPLQHLPAGSASNQAVRIHGIELAVVSLLASLRFSDQASTTTWITSADQLIRFWAVLIGMDGLLQMGTAYLQGRSITTALSEPSRWRHWVRAPWKQVEPATPRTATNVPDANIVPGIVIPVLVCAWLMTGVVVIGPGERGLRWQCGLLVQPPLEPGLHFALPTPFGRVQRYRVTTIREQTIGFHADPQQLSELRFSWTAPHGSDETPYLVGDGTELVAVNALVAYRIGADDDALIEYATKSTDPEGTLLRLSRRTLTLATRSMAVEDILSCDQWAWGLQLRNALQQQVREAIPGMEIVAVRILSIHPPVEVAKAFLDQVSARMDAERLVAEARGAAETERFRSRMMSATQIADARGAASQRLTAIETEAAMIAALAELDLSDSEITRRNARLEMLVEALEHRPFTVLEAGLPPEVRLWFGKESAAPNIGARP